MTSSSSSSNSKRTRAKTRKKRACHRAAADIQPQVQYDTALACLLCKTELIISEEDARSLIQTVRSGGIVVLICAVCGLQQPVRLKPPH